MGTPTLPSAMHHFTAEFGMGSGGTNALMPPGKLAGLIGVRVKTPETHCAFYNTVIEFLL